MSPRANSFCRFDAFRWCATPKLFWDDAKLIHFLIRSLSALTSGAPSDATVALDSTYSGGAAATKVSGAPALPAGTPSPANYPALDVSPPTNSSEVQGWLAKVSTGLGSEPRVDGARSALTRTRSTCPRCPTTTSPTAPALELPVPSPTADVGGLAVDAVSVETGRANRSIAYCAWFRLAHDAARETDITECPDKMTWGLSYDDGPSPYTPLLLDYLDEKNITSTFFLVGSRVISRPQMVQSEYMAGHQLSVHTWSHPYLTKLTNEQIVAELGWTKKVIYDVTGVTPNTFRPPYGDIDDRVRAIAAQMGLTPIIWSSIKANGTTTNFDTVSQRSRQALRGGSLGIAWPLLTLSDRLEHPRWRGHWRVVPDQIRDHPRHVRPAARHGLHRPRARSVPADRRPRRGLRPAHGPRLGQVPTQVDHLVSRPPALRGLHRDLVQHHPDHDHLCQRRLDLLPGFDGHRHRRCRHRHWHWDGVWRERCGFGFLGVFVQERRAPIIRADQLRPRLGRLCRGRLGYGSGRVIGVPLKVETRTESSVPSETEFRLRLTFHDIPTQPNPTLVARAGAQNPKYEYNPSFGRFRGVFDSPHTTFHHTRLPSLAFCPSSMTRPRDETQNPRIPFPST